MESEVYQRVVILAYTVNPPFASLCRLRYSGIASMRTSLLFLLAAAAAAQSDIKVAAVQFRSSFDVADNGARIERKLAELSRQGVRVGVFPECALTGYHKDAIMKASAEAVEAAEGRVRRACREGRIAAVFGSVYKVNGRTYNTAVVVDSGGELVERYGKMFLAGEKWATPGNHISYFSLEGIPSTAMVCHDERYPELVRLPALEGARVVYYISSESGITQEAKLAPYRAQIVARAVENQVFVVAANAPADPERLQDSSHGQSRIVAPDGTVLREASFFGEDTLIETLAVKPGRLTAAMGGQLADWWKQGLEWMRRNRTRPLD